MYVIWRFSISDKVQGGYIVANGGYIPVIGGNMTDQGGFKSRLCASKNANHESKGISRTEVEIYE